MSCRTVVVCLFAGLVTAALMVQAAGAAPGQRSSHPVNAQSQEVVGLYGPFDDQDDAIACANAFRQNADVISVTNPDPGSDQEPYITITWDRTTAPSIQWNCETYNPE
jgi:hypothetical protein